MIARRKTSSHSSRLIFSSKSYWLWDGGGRRDRNAYLSFRRVFSLRPEVAGKPAMLRITADAYYQVSLNRRVVGHGPAKSPDGQRFVDCYDLADFLRAGENELEISVHTVGVGTMSYCLGDGGLIFEIHLPGQVIGSDEKTSVRRDRRRNKKTVRRWVLPALEDVDTLTDDTPWESARIVKKSCRLLLRPVPLPTRTPFTPRRTISLETVTLPTFSVSFRVKPYLVTPEEAVRWNLYRKPAYLVVDLVSSHKQDLTLVPTAGEVSWYFRGHKIITGLGWDLWDPTTERPVLRLRKGANRLVGVLYRNHFEEIHLAGYSPFPIQSINPAGNSSFQIIPISNEDGHLPLSFRSRAEDTRSPLSSADCGKRLSSDFERAWATGGFPKMDPDDSLLGGNVHDLVVNARSNGINLPIGGGRAATGWKIPGAPKGSAQRLIVDLDAVQQGWLSFRTRGRRGSRLIFAFFEALEYGPPLKVNWTAPCNNAFSCYLRDGLQSFETFFPYGVRYIAIHHVGVHPVELEELVLHSAHCGGPTLGDFRSDDSRLDQIYALCTQTLYAATDDTLTDCPTYEAVNWNFDNRMAALGDMVTFRNTEIIRHTIEQYIHDPRFPALVRSHAPSTWDNRIPIFSFHWILLVHEFYQATSNQDFLRRVFPQVSRGLEEVLGMLQPNGLIRWPDVEEPWHMIDWHPGRDDNHPFVSAEQAVLVGTLEAGASLARSLAGRRAPSYSKHWLRQASKLRTSIHRHFWSPDRDAYADSIHEDGVLSSVSSQASNAAVAFHGIGSEAWKRRLVKRIRQRDQRLLVCGCPMGLFYVLEFLDQRREVDLIFQIILEKWGQMLDAGDRTTWEHFPEYGQTRFPTRSRCHPFATYILKYYAKYLLGFEASALEVKKIYHRPQPPSWMKRGEGMAPTRAGILQVGWERQGRTLNTRIERPSS